MSRSKRTSSSEVVSQSQPVDVEELVLSSGETEPQEFTHSSQDGGSTSTPSQSTSEASSSSEKSAPSEDSTQNTPTEPMAVMHFGQNGIRITLSDDMVRVGGAALERAYVMLLRQCNIQRMQAVHGTKGEVNV